jgi:hypothetical protein
MENNSTTNSKNNVANSGIETQQIQHNTTQLQQQQLLMLQQKQKSLPRCTRDIVLLAVNSGEIEEIEGTTFVSIWDQCKETRSLPDGQAKFMSKLREKLGPRADRVYLSIRKRMKEASETLEKMKVQYKIYQLQKKQKQMEEQKSKESSLSTQSVSHSSGISTIQYVDSSIQKNLLNPNNIQMKQNSSSKSAVTTTEVISPPSTINEIEKNERINSNIVSNINVNNNNNNNNVPLSIPINNNLNTIIPKKIILESISENIMDGYKLTDLSKNIVKQKGMILDITAAEILSKGIQLHIKNILEESISCSKQRRNKAGLQSFKTAVDSLKLGRYI